MKSQSPVHNLKTKSQVAAAANLPGSGNPMSNAFMARTLSRIIVPIGLLFSLAGCNQNLGAASLTNFDANDLSQGQAAAAAVTFSDVKDNVFVPHCLKCHSTDIQKGDIDLERFETAFAVAAMIREEVESDRMPRRAPPLTAELKALLFAWIDAGAPEK
jgi:hypothetical protein